MGANLKGTTSQEIRFYRTFRRIGRDDLAAKVRDAALRYGMTREFVVGERYHDSNPWYFPWSPNASGAGRLLEMLTDSQKRDRKGR